MLHVTFIHFIFNIACYFIWIVLQISFSQHFGLYTPSEQPYLATWTILLLHVSVYVVGMSHSKAFGCLFHITILLSIVDVCDRFWSPIPALQWLKMWKSNMKFLDHRWGSVMTGGVYMRESWNVTVFTDIKFYNIYPELESEYSEPPVYTSVGTLSN